MRSRFRFRLSSGYGYKGAPGSDRNLSLTKTEAADIISAIVANGIAANLSKTEIADSLIATMTTGGGGASTLLDTGRLWGSQVTPMSYYGDVVCQDVGLRVKNDAINSGTNSLKFMQATEVLRVQSISRDGSGTCNVVLSSPPPSDVAFMATGNRVITKVLADPTFDVDQVLITVTDQTHFSFPLAGAAKTITAANASDIIIGVWTGVNVGPSGHPIVDHYALYSDILNHDLDATYTLHFPGSVPSGVSADGWALSGSGATRTLVCNGTDSSFLALTLTGVATDDSYRRPTIIRNTDDTTGATTVRADSKVFLERYGGLRFMDGNKTNNNCFIQSWDNRPRGGGGQGYDLETMVDICDEIGCDQWHNIALLADDDYVTNMATLHRDRWSGNTRYELGNENWNGDFQQWHWLGTMVRYELNARCNGWDGYSQIVSVTRTGTAPTQKVTVVLDAQAIENGFPYTEGQTVVLALYDNNGGDLGDVNTGIGGKVIHIESSNSFSYTLTGTNGSKDVSQRAICFSNTSSNLLAGSSNVDLNNLICRMHCRRTYEISQLIKAVYGSLGGRAQVYLMWEIYSLENGHFGPIVAEMIKWSEAALGVAFNTWCSGIGAAAYAVANAGSSTTTADVRNSMAASMLDMRQSIHHYKFHALQKGVKLCFYEGAPSLQQFDGSKQALVDSFFVHDDMRAATENNINEVMGMGVDEYCLFQTAIGRAGTPGPQAWSKAYNMTEGGGPPGTPTSKPMIGIDNCLLAAPPPNLDKNVLPGTLYFLGGGGASWLDENPSTFSDGTTNGMLQLYDNANSSVQASVYLTAGTLPITIYGALKKGSGGGSSNGVRIYLNNTLQGTLNLYEFTTGSDLRGNLSGNPASGGNASPTAFSLVVPSDGWYHIKIRCPVNQPELLGISKITA